MPTILLIEDNWDTARMVIRLLERHQHVVHHAADGFTGLQMARRIRPELVLVDLGLPDLNGKVVALQLRSFFSHPPIPIVAFTAETGARAKRLALGFGCDYFLTKPIDTQAFPDQIERIMSGKEPTTDGC